MQRIRQAYEEKKEMLAAASGRQYCTTNMREFFAEVFCMYLQGDDINNMGISSFLWMPAYRKPYLISYSRSSNTTVE